MTDIRVELKQESTPDLESWCLDHRIGDGLCSVLVSDIGVVDVDDLVDVLGDKELMSSIKYNSPPLDFKRFLQATSTTPNLKGVPIALPQSENEAKEFSTVQRLKDQVFSEIIKQEHLKTELKEREILEKKLLDLQSSTSELSSKANVRSKAELKAKIKIAEERTYLIKALDLTLRNASSVDIAFLTDCTGSMRNHMNNIKEQIMEMVKSCETMYPDLCVRVAFVGYRDYCNGQRRLVVHPFSSDISAFQRLVGSQVAAGGCGDFADVFGGLNEVDKLQWQASTRVLFHIGDMPGHGKEWNDSCDDPFPDGDPAKLSANDILFSLVQKEVMYFFGRITSHTDKMIEKFNQIVESYVEIVEVRDANLMMDSLSRSVSNSISITHGTSSSTNTMVDTSHIILDLSEPKWDVLTPESIKSFEMQMPSSIEDLKGLKDVDSVQQLPKITTSKVGLLPFAKGGCRLAFMVKDLTVDGLSPKDLSVHKVHFSNKSSDLSRHKYESNLSGQSVAFFLAQEFNKLTADLLAAPYIHFSKVSLIQYLDRKDTPYATSELMLSGKWEKFNGNDGYLLNNPSSNGVDHSILQAFSHWTHVVTDHFLMVVDLQGNFHSTSRGSFFLTDPAVHCRDMTRFGGTNLGKIGFERFFKTHKCNGFCNALNL